jgi:hypothetical protein
MLLYIKGLAGITEISLFAVMPQKSDRCRCHGHYATITIIIKATNELTLCIMTAEMKHHAILEKFKFLIFLGCMSKKMRNFIQT